MDDIQFAFSVSPKFGQLYQQAKAFSSSAPALSLAHLRGLAYSVCKSLDREFSATDSLAARIKSLDQRGMLNPSMIRHLRILQQSGNKAAHPESYDYETHDFSKLAAEGMKVGRQLLEGILDFRNQSVPDYFIAEVGDSALRDMCYQSMIVGDLEAIHQAGKYFKAQADQISADAIGGVTLDGYKLEAEEQIAQAMFWFKKGAEKNHPDCMYQYGAYHFHTRDADQSLRSRAEWYISRAAGEGHADALALVADCSLTGVGGFIKDEGYAREMYELAAAQDHPGALAQLGAIYAEGIGGQVDLEAAAKYTTKAAEAGFPQGQYNLFTLYERGLGVERDETQGLKWLQLAASQDYPDAIYNLARVIHAGRLPGKSLEDARDLYRRLSASRRFKAHGALGMARVLLELQNDLEGWVTSAFNAQICFEILHKDGDPHGLLKGCLSIGKQAISKVRQHIKKHGPKTNIDRADLLVCLLYDQEGRPTSDRAAKTEEFSNLLLQAGEGNNWAKNQAEQILLEATGISSMATSATQKSVRTVSPAFGHKDGRNYQCHCGSGQKFKKCHGR